MIEYIYTLRYELEKKMLRPLKNAADFVFNSVRKLYCYVIGAKLFEKILIS